MAELNGARHGRAAIVVPSANPTVEPEMRQLLPAALDYFVTRLPTNEKLSLEERNAVYVEQYGAALATYGKLQLDAAFIALTGASYRLLHAGDVRLCKELEDTAGLPVATASVAIHEVLEHIGAKSIGLVSPYPEWLTQTSVDYWRASGFTVDKVVSVSEEFKAYELTDDEILESCRALDTEGCDAVLVTGTGARTIKAMQVLKSPVPLLSSNLCGAWWLSRQSGMAVSAETAALCPAIF